MGRTYVVGACWHRRVESWICAFALVAEDILVDAVNDVYQVKFAPQPLMSTACMSSSGDAIAEHMGRFASWSDL
eukprot:5348341-Pleurochrysis_carterae.AAC.1